MTVRYLLPVALCSALVLAACENRADAPSLPNPDAGNPEAFSDPSSDADASSGPMTPQELEQRREEIEQDAQRRFDDIMDQTRQAGDDLVQLGDDAMTNLSEGMNSAADSIERQIDALVESAAQRRDETLTDAQKLDIVANVRNAAEEATRALGRSEAEITAAGETAEARTRTVLGLD